MGDQDHPSTKFTWNITVFSNLRVRKCYSDTFTVNGSKWSISVYPKGNKTDHLSVYLEVPDAGTLPTGWSRDAKFSLSVVNQFASYLTKTKNTQHNFNSRETDWGFTSFMPLCELYKKLGGFLVDDIVEIEANVEVLSVHPPIIRTPSEAPSLSAPTEFRPAMSTHRFDAFFASLREFINDSSISTSKPGSSSENILDLNSKIPSIEEVEQAKKSLKECLSDLFKLNMKERLAEALLTLSLAKDGLTPNQQKAVIAFWANFDEFTSDFLMFEQDNAEYELQKLSKDQMFATMKKNHETHLSYKQSLSDLYKEEEELKKRLEEVETKRTTLMLDWESLLAVSEDLKLNYKIKEKKVVDAEEKKRIAEERMSFSTTAWASLKKQFG